MTKSNCDIIWMNGIGEIKQTERVPCSPNKAVEHIGTTDSDSKPPGGPK
jgi:hypothetical protein